MVVVMLTVASKFIVNKNSFIIDIHIYFVIKMAHKYPRTLKNLFNERVLNICMYFQPLCTIKYKQIVKIL